MSMCGDVVDLPAADVGEDNLGVLRFLSNQALLRGDRGRNSRCVIVGFAGVVEGEAHIQHNGALQALARVGRPFRTGRP